MIDWTYFILFAGQTLASGTFLAGKWALIDFPPLTLVMLRSLIAAGGLYVVHLLWPGRKPIARRDWAMLAFLGLLSVVINQAFFLYGLEFTTPTHAALLYGTTPVFVYLLAVPLIKERTSWLKLAGVIATFIGVAVIVTRQSVGWGDKTWLGDILILLAVVAWALNTVLGKPMVAKYGGVHVTAITLIIGALLYIPVGAFTWHHFDITATTTRGWWSLMYMAIGTSVIAYTVWFWALGKMEATKVAVFNNLGPVITALLSYWLMDEHLGPRLLVGGGIVIVGVILTERG